MYVESCYINLLLNCLAFLPRSAPEWQEGQVSRTERPVALSGSAVSCNVNNMSRPMRNIVKDKVYRWICIMPLDLYHIA